MSLGGFVAGGTVELPQSRFSASTARRPPHRRRGRGGGRVVTLAATPAAAQGRAQRGFDAWERPRPQVEQHHRRERHERQARGLAERLLARPELAEKRFFAWFHTSTRTNTKATKRRRAGLRKSLRDKYDAGSRTPTGTSGSSSTSSRSSPGRRAPSSSSRPTTARRSREGAVRARLRGGSTSCACRSSSSCPAAARHRHPGAPSTQADDPRVAQRRRTRPCAASLVPELRGGRRRTAAIVISQPRATTPPRSCADEEASPGTPGSVGSTTSPRIRGRSTSLKGKRSTPWWLRTRRRAPIPRSCLRLRRGCLNGAYRTKK